MFLTYSKISSRLDCRAPSVPEKQKSDTGCNSRFHLWTREKLGDGNGLALEHISCQIDGLVDGLQVEVVPWATSVTRVEENRRCIKRISREKSHRSSSVARVSLHYLP